MEGIRKNIGDRAIEEDDCQDRIYLYTYTYILEKAKIQMVFKPTRDVRLLFRAFIKTFCDIPNGR